MSVVDDEVAEVLQDAGYEIVARGNGDGFTLEMPEHKFAGLPARRIEMVVDRGGAEGPVGLHLEDVDFDRVFIPLPEYTLRYAITWLFTVFIQERGYDKNYVVVHDAEGNRADTVVDLIAPPRSAKLIDLEGVFVELIDDAISNDFPEEFRAVAEEHGVLEGYDAFFTLYDGVASV